MIRGLLARILAAEAGEPPRSGAPDNPVEDRLGLIVAPCVRPPRPRRHEHGRSRSASRIGPARLGLEVPGSDRPPVAEVERQPERRRQFGHERGIGPRRLTASAWSRCATDSRKPTDGASRCNARKSPTLSPPPETATIQVPPRTRARHRAIRRVNPIDPTHSSTSSGSADSR